MITLKLTDEQADILVRLLGGELAWNHFNFDETERDTMDLLELMIAKELP